MIDGLVYVRFTSAAHFGSGSGQGSIDLPIAREADTGLPFAPGSALRGGFRADCDPQDPRGDAGGVEFRDLFGPSFDDPDKVSGILQFDDVRLLALPVSSRKGMMAWATSPFLLARYREAASDAGMIVPPCLPRLDQDDGCLATDVVATAVDGRQFVFASDLALQAQLDCAADAGSERWAWADHLGRALFSATSDVGKYFLNRLLVVSDTAMRYLSEFATDVRPRIRRDPSGIATDQSLWFEEHLPRDTLLFGEWSAQPVRNAAKVKDMAAVARWLTGQPLDNLPEPRTRIQFGGKSSVNKGCAQLTFRWQQ